MTKELTDDDRTFLTLLGRSVAKGAEPGVRWQVRQVWLDAFDAEAERLSQEGGE